MDLLWTLFVLAVGCGFGVAAMTAVLWLAGWIGTRWAVTAVLVVVGSAVAALAVFG